MSIVLVHYSPSKIRGFLSKLTNEMLDFKSFASFNNNSDNWEMLVTYLHEIAISLKNKKNYN